jgi:molybdopterin biosynthesis enzyme MoaB
MKVESTVKPKQVKILGDKVLVRSNILQIDRENEDGSITEIYEYDEEKFNKNNYIEMLKEENTNLQEELSTAQDALNFIIMNGGV